MISSVLFSVPAGWDRVRPRWHGGAGMAPCGEQTSSGSCLVGGLPAGQLPLGAPTEREVALFGGADAGRSHATP